jgi:protein-S-isoprenylcysteine O-methyltransferase Ste14
MKNVRVVFVGVWCCLVIPTPAHALVILPALILIPIAKILAVALVALGVPATALGLAWSKLTRHPFKKTLLVVGVVLFLLVMGLGIYLRITNPDRPLY